MSTPASPVIKRSPAIVAGLAALLLMGGVGLCSCSFFLSALFFPIGPEGLSPRDAFIRELTGLMDIFGVGSLCLGAALLVVALGVWLLSRRR